MNSRSERAWHRYLARIQGRKIVAKAFVTMYFKKGSLAPPNLLDGDKLIGYFRRLKPKYRNRYAK